jgi:alanyl-tRNA synthetase
VTDRLYYTDSYLTRFDAAVVAVTDSGGRPGVVLDRTAFYPASGGQPFDLGTLGDARVVEVLEGDDGRIVHVIDGPVPSGRVEGSVDWSRRFEHMQQHTGQHILSAAFHTVCGVPTVSFHLGAEVSTIDLATGVAPGEIARAETAANEAVWKDLPVSVRFVDAADAAALPLRKESTRTGPLRIVEVEGLDVSACGGTHVSRAGAVGMVAVTAWERFKGGTRVEFRCGVRALRAHRADRDILAACSRTISAAKEELPTAIERLQAEMRDAKRLVKDLTASLAAREAEALAARAPACGGARWVFEAMDRDVSALKALAQAIAAHAGTGAVLVTSLSPVSVVVARAADVDADAGAALQELTARFGGRGGGRRELAQGGGLAADPADVIAAARAYLC